MVHCMVMVSMSLTRPVSHLQCTKIIWQSKHQKEIDTLLQRFLTHGLKKQNVATKSVTSTDGTLTIPQTNNCARKPGQRKREECKNIFLQKKSQS
jgi:hypothetical protein